MADNDSMEIGGDQFLRMLASPDCRSDAELTDLLFTPVYTFSNGSYLVQITNRRGRWYRSKDDLLKLVNVAQPGQSSYDHLLLGGRSFLKDVEGYAMQLAAILGLENSKLDFTLCSVQFVDQAIRRIGPLKFFDSSFYTPLLAYIGEVIRRHCRGFWEIREYSDRGEWEPIIVTDLGQTIAPDRYIRRELEAEEGPLIRERMRAFLPDIFN